MIHTWTKDWTREKDAIIWVLRYCYLKQEIWIFSAWETSGLIRTIRRRFILYNMRSLIFIVQYKISAIVHANRLNESEWKISCWSLRPLFVRLQLPTPPRMRASFLPCPLLPPATIEQPSCLLSPTLPAVVSVRRGWCWTDPMIFSTV